MPRPWTLRTIVPLASLLLAGGLAWRFLPLRGDEESGGPTAGSARAPQRSTARRGTSGPVAVETVAAKSESLRVVQTALGTVVPYQSVNVRSRVGGQLVRVHFREGDLVKKGDLLAEIDPRPFQAELSRVEGLVVRDRAILENAELDLTRYQALGREKIAKQEDVQARHSLVRQYEGALHAGQGSLQQAALQLSFSRVTAPISGRIGLRQVDAGNNIDPSDPGGIAVINQVEPIAVLFSIPEDDVRAIVERLEESRKNGALLTAEAWDKGSKRRLAVGKLLTLDNQIDPGTGTLKLKAEFTNEDGALFPNQFVNVRLLLEVRSNSIVIPDAAVQYGNMGPFVWAVSEKKTVALRQIELGPIDGSRVSVQRGLESGEIVVTSGADRLREGANVLVRGGEERTGEPERRAPGQRRAGRNAP